MPELEIATPELKKANGDPEPRKADGDDALEDEYSMTGQYGEVGVVRRGWWRGAPPK